MFDSRHRHLRFLFSGCVLLLLTCRGTLTSLSADEMPAQDCCCPRKSQPQLQRTNADRVNDFYQSARELQAQQDRADTRLWRYMHPPFGRARSFGYGAPSGFSGR